MIQVLVRHPAHADALAMVGESEAELSQIYAPEHRSAFSPDQLIEAGVEFMVAYDGDAPVGCGGYVPLGRDGELKRIFSLKSARGRGVGGAIIAALEGHARAAGLTRMLLETGEASPEAIGLYEKTGYARRGPFGAYVENGSSVFMEKML